MKIMLIEDSPTEAILIKNWLKPLGLSISHFYDLSEVDDTSDVIFTLLDLSLGKTSGVQTIETYQKQFPYVPYMVLTSFEDKRIQQYATENKAKYYIIKDYGPDFSKKVVNTAKTLIEDLVSESPELYIKRLKAFQTYFDSLMKE